MNVQRQDDGYGSDLMQTFNEIVPGLFQGSHPEAMPSNIEAVLNVDYRAARYPTDTLKHYVHLPILDGPSPGIQWLLTALSILEELRANNFNTYIHCQAGISRSVFVTAALLIKEKVITPKAAIALINSKSGIADPAPAFILELRKFYETLV